MNKFYYNGEPIPEPEEIKLSPCPFCGSAPALQCFEPHEHVFAIYTKYGGGAFVECTGCTAAMSAETMKEVIERWNRRSDGEKN